MRRWLQNCFLRTRIHLLARLGHDRQPSTVHSFTFSHPAATNSRFRSWLRDAQRRNASHVTLGSHARPDRASHLTFSLIDTLWVLLIDMGIKDVLHVHEKQTNVGSKPGIAIGVGVLPGLNKGTPLSLIHI